MQISHTYRSDSSSVFGDKDTTSASGSGVPAGLLFLLLLLSMTLSEVCRGTAEEEVEWSLLSLPETSEDMSVVGGFRWIVEKKLSEIKGEAFLCSGRVRQFSDQSE